MPDYKSEALTLKRTSLLFVSEYQHYVFMNPSSCVTTCTFVLKPSMMNEME